MCGVNEQEDSKTDQPRETQQTPIQRLTMSGMTGPQIARRVLEMVGALHDRGFESLYLDAQMAPSGMYWRYEIGAISDGLWPAGRYEPDQEPMQARGSICDDCDGCIPWSKPDAPVEQLVEDFVVRHSDLLDTARNPNTAYRQWFREMLEETAPAGVMVFAAEYQGNYEYAFLADRRSDYRKAMPPGYRGD
jgi:hypothetical protein